MSTRSALASSAVALCCALGALPAHAAGAVYSLDDAPPSSNLGAGPFGTVTLVQDGTNVDFTVDLVAGFDFVMTGNQNSHVLFAFNGTGVSLGDITGMANGTASTFYAYQPSTGSPFGDFAFGIDCSSCAKGGAGAAPPPLTFTVDNALVSDFASMSTGGSPDAYFAADVINLASGSTGEVGATSADAAPVPEPASASLLLAGLAAFGFVARRRRA